jgi:hypothetical protein
MCLMGAEKTGGTVPGGCYCGRVRFEVTLPSRFCSHCHCDNCRRAHGAAFVTWAGIRREQFRIAAGEESLVRYRTETGATRSFCRHCGSTLLYEGPRWPGEIHVALSNIDAPIDRLPAEHVYVDHKAAWFEISDSLPQFGGTSGTGPREPVQPT